MSCKYPILLLVCFLTFSAAYSQSSSVIHIVTLKNNLPALQNFRFTVNGIPYKLKSGNCMDIHLKADSIHLDIQDVRTLKKPNQDLHMASAPEVHVFLYLSYEGVLKDGRFIAEANYSCYEELKAKCKKTITATQ